MSRSTTDATEWQVRLLPFLIVLIIVLTALFSLTNLYQAFSVNTFIQSSPPSRLMSTADTHLLLEEYAIANRYHQAHVILMSRVYVIYIGFTTGMIMALVGAAFILAKLSEPSSQIAAEGAALKLSLITTSPGLAMAVLGTTLMITTILTRAEVNVTDRALYVSRDASSTFAQDSVASPDSILREVLRP